MRSRFSLSRWVVLVCVLWGVSLAVQVHGAPGQSNQPGTASGPSAEEDQAAVRAAATRYNAGWIAGDARAVYEQSSTETRLFLRAIAGVMPSDEAANDLDVLDIDDIDGFVEMIDFRRLIESLLQGEGVTGTKMPLVSRFARIVSVEIDGAVARCYVVDAPDQAIGRRPRGFGGEGGIGIAWAAAAPGAEQGAIDEATGLLMLRREGEAWRVSMAVPTRTFSAMTGERGQLELERAVPVPRVMTFKTDGGLRVDAILASCVKDAKRYQYVGILDVYGAMTLGFQAFLESRLGETLADPHVELAFSYSPETRGGELQLLNGDTETAAALGGMTDAMLWDRMVEFAASR